MSSLPVLYRSWQHKDNCSCPKGMSILFGEQNVVSVPTSPICGACVGERDCVLGAQRMDGDG